MNIKTAKNLSARVLESNYESIRNVDDTSLRARKTARHRFRYP